MFSLVTRVVFILASTKKERLDHIYALSAVIKCRFCQQGRPRSDKVDFSEPQLDFKRNTSSIKYGIAKTDQPSIVIGYARFVSRYNMRNDRWAREWQSTCEITTPGNLTYIFIYSLTTAVVGNAKHASYPNIKFFNFGILAARVLQHLLKCTYF